MDTVDLATMRALWWSHLQPFRVHPALALEVFDDLAARHGAAGRHYHNLDHVRDVLSRVDWGAPLDSPSAVAFACWFHDVIYDSKAHDNEERSAAYAREALQSLGVPAEVREETARLILLTRGHETTADDQRGRELLDSDLAILAEDQARYDAYAAAIRQEYAWVNDEDYREGRRRVLERFLARPRLYLTDRMYTAGEGRARANLAREIAALSGGVVPGLQAARDVRGE